MALIVQKLGETSVGTVEHIKQVAEKVKKFRGTGDDAIVAISAMSGEANRLVDPTNQIMEQPTPRELDVMVSTRGQVIITLLGTALTKRGVPAVSYTGNQVHILTNNAHTKAYILYIDDTHIRTDLKTGRVVVTAGFRDADGNGDTTTLDHGGSNTTEVALATMLKADERQICTDVDGIYTTDPRVVPQARQLDKITFEEMLEMANPGPKMLRIRVVEFVDKYNAPLCAPHNFQEGPDILIIIDDEGESIEQPTISGIIFNRDEAKLTIRGVSDTPSVTLKILGPISAANVEIDMIMQNVTHNNTTGFTFVVRRNDYLSALGILERAAANIGTHKVIGDTNIAKASIVSIGMCSHTGVANYMFEVLTKESINIQMVSTSEIKASVMAEEKYLELMVHALYMALKFDTSA